MLEGRIFIVWEAIDCETHVCVVAVVITRHRRQMALSPKAPFRASPGSWRSWTQSALALRKTRASKRHTCHEKTLLTAVLRLCASETSKIAIPKAIARRKLHGIMPEDAAIRKPRHCRKRYTYERSPRAIAGKVCFPKTSHSKVLL